MVHIKAVFQSKIVNELDGINAHFILYEPITLYNLIPFVDCYNRIGCKRKSCWCRSWGHFVCFFKDMH